MTIVLFVLMAFLLRVLPYRQINVKASFLEAVLSCLLALIMSLLLKSSETNLIETMVVIAVCFIVCQIVAVYQKKKRFCCCSLLLSMNCSNSLSANCSKCCPIMLGQAAGA